tara:strand:+ start:717 stop:893 length:177 start_codon:yes stop_codon:yes gene_type:complete
LSWNEKWLEKLKIIQLQPTTILLLLNEDKTSLINKLKIELKSTNDDNKKLELFFTNHV